VVVAYGYYFKNEWAKIAVPRTQRKHAARRPVSPKKAATNPDRMMTPPMSLLLDIAGEVSYGTC